jgi:RNA polymerase sigma-70 factor, ECF subfamily
MYPEHANALPASRRVCPDAFVDVLMASLANLRHLALKLTRSQSDADDLLQATCLRALESAARLRNHSNLTAWLGRVMRNLQIDLSRSRSRRTVPLTDRVVAACAPEGIAMWRQVEDAEVELALPRLSPQLRAVWELHHADGLDQNRIAVRLGIPRTTVATRLFRARLALRTALLERYEGARPRLRVHAGGKATRTLAPAPRSTGADARLAASAGDDDALLPPLRTAVSAL